jgi:hypothetical protein
MKRSDVVSTINGLEGEAGHQRILDVYNSQSPLPRGYRLTSKDAWCAATVSAVYLLNGFDGVSECSCPRMIEKAKALGIWQESDSYIPKPGDCIMYAWQASGTGDGVGVADHTGIVIAVDGQNITVREGNKNKSIGNRQIKVDGRYIRGYITPEFDEVPESVFEPEVNTADLPLLRSGSKGKAVAVWQIIVDAIPDGEFGANTIKATKIFQGSKGLEADGIVGFRSWTAGLESLREGK